MSLFHFNISSFNVLQINVTKEFKIGSFIKDIINAQLIHQPMINPQYV